MPLPGVKKCSTSSGSSRRHEKTEARFFEQTGSQGSRLTFRLPLRRLVILNRLFPIRIAALAQLDVAQRVVDDLLPVGYQRQKRDVGHLANGRLFVHEVLDNGVARRDVGPILLCEAMQQLQRQPRLGVRIVFGFQGLQQLLIVLGIQAD